MKGRVAVLWVLALAVPGPLFAGPWAKGKGKQYFKLTYQHLGADKLAQPDGTVLPIPHYTQDGVWFYGERGVSDTVNLILDLPLLRSSDVADEGNELPRETGIGDFRGGAQWQFARHGNWVFATKGLLQAPTGDETKGDGLLPTGSGVWEGVASLGAGTSLHGGRGWAYAEAGYQYRGGGLRDGVVYEAQLGWSLGSRLQLAANLRGVEPFSHEAPENPIGSPSGLGDRVTYTAYGASAYLKVGGGFSLQLDVDSAFNTHNIAEGATFRVGLAFEN